MKSLLFILLSEPIEREGSMEYKFLSKINSPEDLKSLDFEKLKILATEIRYKLIETVSHNGGHLASNLGSVELTIALHKVFSSPKDKILFDVGHQCYTHKLLTGRFDRFSTLRTKDGISGFCRPDESEHDVFYSGHSGTSVSAGLGLAKANQLKGDDGYVVSVIGDGSFTGGMVYEALNNGGRSDAKHIVILNDNNMSISENVGSFAKYLAVIRSNPKYSSFKSGTEKFLGKLKGGKGIIDTIRYFKTNIKNKLYLQSTFFEDLGYHYMGPIDGHNTELLCTALESARMIDGPVVIHAITVKGKGYEFAEKEPSIFHGISKFDIYSGEAKPCRTTYSDKVGEILCSLAEKDSSVCAITAAMSIGTGLAGFADKYPDRFFDVGIAEEHAVTFASGLAKKGMKPVCAIYSTFLQRCYDQIIHDVSLQKQKVVFAVDRAGFVGEDGETHHGLFDVNFFGSVPGIKVYSPCNFKLLEDSLTDALYCVDSAVAVRYPRGSEKSNTALLNQKGLEFSIYGKDTAEKVIVTYGGLTSNAIDAVDSLAEVRNDILLVSLNQIKPFPKDAFEVIKSKKEIYFFEESMKSGGIGEKLASMLLEVGYKGKYKITAVEDEYVCPAEIKEQLKMYRLDTDSMIKIISGEN